MTIKSNLLVIGTAIGIATLATAAVSATDTVDKSTGHQQQTLARDAKPLQGRLQVRWGDGPPGPRRTSNVWVTLVEDNGRHHVLDPVSAARAAGNLRSLDNRRVAVTLSQSRAAVSGMSGLLVPEVIVPVDDLVNGGGLASKAGDFSTRAISGPTPWITVMCKFNGSVAEPKPKSYFVDMYANVAGRLDHYWRQVSHQSLNLTGSNASGWYTLKQTHAYYFPGGGVAPKWNELTTQCLAAADPSVQYSNYYGINMVFDGELDGFAYSDDEYHTLDGVSKDWRVTANPSWAWRSVSGVGYSGIATLAHEMGHGYGLHHSDNFDNDSDTYDNDWDMMSGGWYSQYLDPTYGKLPHHLITHHRNQLGWIAPARLKTHVYTTGTVTYTLDRASLQGSVNTQMIKLMVPGATNHHYTIEARKKLSGGGEYESALRGNAVIIHSVKEHTSGGSVTARSVYNGFPLQTGHTNKDRPIYSMFNAPGNQYGVSSSWASPEPAGRRFRVEVLTETTSGFTVRISSL